MNYRVNPKNGDRLSVLGFGCMRFPRDEGEIERLVSYAIDNGVNYFDTAYIYPGNEAALGRALKKAGRDQVKIATKMPWQLVKKRGDLDRIFAAQLARLQTDRIDYYLIHMLSDAAVWARLVGLGILHWIDEKKRSGQIVNIGFSYHGGRQEFVRLIDAYGWEFCMIQYNFLDENNQAGKSGLQYAASKGIPVMVMEPLRGGKLVTALPKQVYDVWDKAPVRRSPAEWALRWVWNHPEVMVTLSGMGTMAMLQENIRVACQAEANAFTAGDFALFDAVAAILNERVKIPCTGCNYCMPCPSGVDIPTCFACYNGRGIEGKVSSFMKYLMQTGMKADAACASRCTKCGACEARCPQGIAIRAELAVTARALEGVWYRPASALMRKVMRLSG